MPSSSIVVYLFLGFWCDRWEVWLEAWGATLIEAMEALQDLAAKMAREKDTEEGDS
jgi:hypothetical protein